MTRLFNVHGVNRIGLFLGEAGGEFIVAVVLNQLPTSLRSGRYSLGPSCFYRW